MPVIFVIASFMRDSPFAAASAVRTELPATRSAFSVTVSMSPETMPMFFFAPARLSSCASVPSATLATVPAISVADSAIWCAPAVSCSEAAASCSAVPATCRMTSRMFFIIALKFAASCPSSSCEVTGRSERCRSPCASASTWCLRRAVAPVIVVAKRRSARMMPAMSRMPRMLRMA